jgi:hypothetical protein
MTTKFSNTSLMVRWIRIQNFQKMTINSNFKPIILYSLWRQCGYAKSKQIKDLKTHLEVQDNCPYQTKRQLWIAINNVLGAYID